MALLWGVAALVAYFVKGLCGFANTLVFTSFMSLGAMSVDISPVDLLLGYPANLMLTWKNRHKLKASVCLPLSAFVLSGSISGALLLKSMNAGTIQLIFGFTVILLGTKRLYPGRSNGRRTSKPLLGFIGLTAGILCGLFGVGALLAAYVERMTENGDEFKANISAVFTVENTFRMILYGILHLITQDTLRTTLLLLPISLLGLLVGAGCSRRLSVSAAKKSMALLLILSGVSLVIKNL